MMIGKSGTGYTVGLYFYYVYTEAATVSREQWSFEIKMSGNS
jgi:hypothetical protein